MVVSELMIVTKTCIMLMVIHLEYKYNNAIKNVPLTKLSSSEINDMIHNVPSNDKMHGLVKTEEQYKDFLC